MDQRPRAEGRAHRGAVVGQESQAGDPAGQEGAARGRHLRGTRRTGTDLRREPRRPPQPPAPVYQEQKDHGAELQEVPQELRQALRRHRRRSPQRHGPRHRPRTRRRTQDPRSPRGPGASRTRTRHGLRRRRRWPRRKETRCQKSQGPLASSTPSSLLFSSHRRWPVLHAPLFALLCVYLATTTTPRRRPRKFRSSPTSRQASYCLR
mmetsp:Transcript_11144/g.33419  ORF Transcript_11144/g.33419 Transcript_11144/m.33419 type:complete len:207 (+) Transcript_11144:1041-1661(+)